MTSFLKLFSFLMLLAVSLHLLPHAEVFVAAEVALLVVYVRARHRAVLKASGERLNAQFDATPGSDNARRLMREAGYAV